MDVIEINGAHIAYRHRRGLGRTIVFANSLGSDQSTWDDVISALPTGYGVLTYDLRGHGLSGGLTDSIEGLADDASQLIDALEITDVVFCGVSIGGMIGQVLTAKRADVIKGSILCNTAAQIGTSQKWTDRIKAVERDGLGAVADTIVDNWFGPDYAAQADRTVLHRAMVARTSDAGYLAACAAIRSADLTGYAPSVTQPVLCIGGPHDLSVPAQSVHDMAEGMKAAQVVILEGLGHLPCLEMPQKLADMIVGFDLGLPKDNLTKQGAATRRHILGAAHVEAAVANVTALDAPFQDLITQGAWGTVWSSPGLSARERSMLTLALLAGLGNLDEIPMHVRATARTGATARDITEAFQHVAIYAGVPRANRALKLAKQTLADMQEAKDD